MGEGGPAAEFTSSSKRFADGAAGAGGVHHVAFRTPDEAQYHGWTRRLSELGIPNSGEVDRFYFRSLYFASRTASCRDCHRRPGFAPTSRWNAGEKLALPPFLEPRRAAIEAGLKPIG